MRRVVHACPRKILLNEKGLEWKLMRLIALQQRKGVIG